MRRSIQYSLVLAMTALLMPGCQTIQFEQPKVLSDSDWLVDGQNQARSRSYDEPVVPPLEMVWEYSANAAFGPGSPLLLDNRILVGTRKGEIHTVELESGRGRGFKRMGDVIEGTPVISEGFMYVPTAWGKRVLIAFDLKKGVSKWRLTGIPFSTSLVVFDDVVVGVDVEGNVRAHLKSDGSQKWSLSLGENQSAKASPLLVGEDRMFVATDMGMGHMIDLSTESILWSLNLGAPVYNAPASSGENIFVSTTRGHLMKIDATTGELLWTIVADNTMVRMGPPAVDGTSVFVGGTDGRFRSVDSSTGAIRWDVQLPDVVSSAPLVSGGYVFVGTLGEELYGFEADTGNIVWKTETEGRIKSAMAVADGGLIVLSEPRWVTYYKPAGGEDND